MTCLENSKCSILLFPAFEKSQHFHLGQSKVKSSIKAAEHVAIKKSITGSFSYSFFHIVLFSKPNTAIWPFIETKASSSHTIQPRTR